MLGPSLPPKTPLSSVPGHELGDSGHSEAIRGERKGEASLPETCPRAWIGAHTWPSLCHSHPWDKLRRQKECHSHGVISRSRGESGEQGTKGGGVTRQNPDLSTGGPGRSPRPPPVRDRGTPVTAGTARKPTQCEPGSPASPGSAGGDGGASAEAGQI